jgi:GT2 family glycosyltransferase
MEPKQIPREGETDLTIILVSYNTAALLPRVFSALDSAKSDLRIQKIIIDNASRDDSVRLIKSNYSDCVLIQNSVNVGFGRANNQAVELIQGRYVLLLNTDAFVEPDTLRKTLSYMETHGNCGALGVRLVGRDGFLQPSCRYFPTPLNIFLKRTGLYRLMPWVKMVDDLNWDHRNVRNCDWVPGCYLLIRREVIAEVGLFDPRYFLYYEEVDWCFAIKKAGWQVHYFPDTTVVHIGGESARTESEITAAGKQIEALQIESELLYFRKNHGLMAVMLNVLLNLVANLFVPIRQLVRQGGNSSQWSYHFKRTGLYFALLRRTRFGSRATR